MKVVARSAPSHRTVEPATKLVPSTVRVNPASPAVLLVGSIPVVVGRGLLTVNVWTSEVPPPGAGLNTVTSKVPAVAMSAAVMVAVSCVSDMKVVARSVPSHLTTERPFTKLVPSTVRVNPGSPAVLLVGSMPVVVGKGFGSYITDTLLLKQFAT